MRRLIHLSDLHFGRTRADLLEPLIAQVNALKPDLIAISGDFTQRARISQYQEAAAFLARLTAPFLAVPGNHDTPLDNIAVRFFNPWGRYRRYIHPETEPVYHDAEIDVVGVNTVNRFSWQRGHLSRKRLDRVCAAFGPDSPQTTQVVVLHHPLEHQAETTKQLMQGARRALGGLSGCGADIVLSGHLHNTHVGPFTAQPGLLFVQAGTGLSTRVRGESNTFNCLDIHPGQVEITSYRAEDNPVFEVAQTGRFRRHEMGWSRVDGVPAGEQAGVRDQTATRRAQR